MLTAALYEAATPHTAA